MTTARDTAEVVSRARGRNLLINGDFSVWQRGISGFSSGYSADRWRVATGALDVSRTNSYKSNNTNWAMAVNRSVSGTVAIEQRIESTPSVSLRDKEVTVSFENTTSSGTLDSIDVSLFSADVPDDFSTTTLIETVNIAAPVDGFNSASFAALPASASQGLSLRVGFNNTGGTTNVISLIQLEEGDLATPFDTVTPADQLARCQRYFEKLSYVSGQTVSTALAAASSESYGPLSFIRKRSTPTIIESGAGTLVTSLPTLGSAGGTANFQTIGTNGCRLAITGASGLVPGNASSQYALGAVDIEIDAEL